MEAISEEGGLEAGALVGFGPGSVVPGVGLLGGSRGGLLEAGLLSCERVAAGVSSGECRPDAGGDGCGDKPAVGEVTWDTVSRDAT